MELFLAIELGITMKELEELQLGTLLIIHNNSAFVLDRGLDLG
jgi:hypothetical protein